MEGITAKEEKERETRKKEKDEGIPRTVKSTGTKVEQAQKQDLLQLFQYQ